MAETSARPGRLLRLHRTLEDLDPWDLLPRLPEGPWAAAWWDPADGRSFVALGLVDERPLVGEDRFAEAAAAVATLPPGDGPCAVVGLAFAAGESGAEWADWGDGRLWLPRLMIHRVDGRTTATATGWTESEAVEALSMLDHWQTSPDRASRPARVAIDDGTEAREHWRESVEAAGRAFDEGTLRKVVLARRAILRADVALDPAATAVTLRAQQPGCTTFLVRQAGSSWVGATPEELVRVHGRDLTTVALAGTRRTDEGAAGRDALLHSDKDRREHGHVVEAIEQALIGVCEEVEVAAAPVVASYAVVQHLRTPIRGRLVTGVGALGVAARLHPTPAVGGVPRARALPWLAGREATARGWYAGPIGWLSASGDGVLVVAIRSALLSGDTAAAWAGCGLVAGSEADAEWRETEAKLAAVASALAVTA